MEESPFDDLIGGAAPLDTNYDGVPIISLSPNPEERKEKKPSTPRKPLSWHLNAPVRWIDHAWSIVWHNMLLMMQWVLLRVVPKRAKSNRKYAHLFRYPSAEEGRKSDQAWKWLSPQSKPLIKMVDTIRRRCMCHDAYRFRIWRWIYFSIVLIVVLFFAFRYTSQQIEIHTYVTPDKMNERTGYRVTNIASMERFALSKHYGEAQQWLFSQCGGPARLDSNALRQGYVDTDSPLSSINRVNISIDELTTKMRRDSRRMGHELPQPCICGVHYGLPVNVVFLRPPPGSNDPVKEEESVLYEPTIQGISRKSKGTVSIDALVVPGRDRGKDVAGRILRLSPLDALQGYLKTNGDEGMEEIFESYSLPNKVFENIVDLTAVGTDGIAPWLLKRPSIPIKDVKDDPQREITIGYENLVVRGLTHDGKPSPATTIHSPHSICVHRCLETLRKIE